MKLALFFAFIIASADAIAQEAPRAVEIHRPASPAPPPIGPTYKTVPSASQPNNPELIELLRAQTSAIKTLSSKLDSLEERIGKIEKGQR